jgi:hypothetical protein
MAYRRPTAASLLHVGILPLIASELVGLMTPHPPISSLTGSSPFGYLRDMRASDPAVFPSLWERVGVRSDCRPPT